MATSTRERMIDGAIELLRERGAAGLTVEGVLERTGAPRGSVYYHFPGGRADLIEQALAVTGDTVCAVFDGSAADPVAALDRFRRFWATILHRTDFSAACPVVSVIVSGAEGDGLDLARATVEKWSDIIERSLVDAGVPETRAKALATTTLAAIEGGVILARSRRSMAPLDAVIDERRELFRAAIDG